MLFYYYLDRINILVFKGICTFLQLENTIKDFDRNHDPFDGHDHKNDPWYLT